MHVSGSATTKNSPTTQNQFIEVPFNVPAGGDLSRVDRTVNKVSLNGNILAAASYTIGTIVAPVFKVTNVSATVPWPANSSIVVECDYKGLSDDLIENMENVWLTLEDHEERIVVLETPTP